MAEVRSVVVCGAGLSGLSVAGELLAAGFAGELTVLDRRVAHVRDRSWCTWATPGALGRFADAVTASWAGWRVVAPDGAVARHHAPATPYVHVDFDRVVALGLDRLDAAPTATLHLGVGVRGIDPEAGRVLTTAGELRADLVVDARAAGAHRALPPGEVELTQRFVGWEVRTERPLRGDGDAVLMDFAALGEPTEGDVRFLYLLPFGDGRTLVEDTSIGETGPPPAVRRAALERWLDAQAVGAWSIERTERGRIPMRSGEVPAVLGPRAVAVGEAAGAVRPSSGYAFSRTQRHARALARAVVAGTAPPARVGTARAATIDRVFLRALAADPAAGPALLHGLVADTSPGLFARFMSDASTPGDDLRIAATVPLRPFAASAVRGVVAPGARTG